MIMSVLYENGPLNQLFLKTFFFKKRGKLYNYVRLQITNQIEKK